MRHKQISHLKSSAMSTPSFSKIIDYLFSKNQEVMSRMIDGIAGMSRVVELLPRWVENKLYGFGAENAEIDVAERAKASGQHIFLVN